MMLDVGIDSELYKILSTECDSNFSGNMSAALDSILWNYFGKPLLSFEKGIRWFIQRISIPKKSINNCEHGV